MLNVFIASFTIMLASLGGVVSVWYRAGRFIEKHLAYLVSLSAGVFLVVTWELIHEVVELAGWLPGLLWVTAGIIVAAILFRALPNFHHHHDEHAERKSHSSIDIRRIVIGDGIHNIGDGLLLATSFAVSPGIGFLTTASVFIHELVQEISEFFVLRQAGLSVIKALGFNFLVSGTILIGAIGGILFLEQFGALKAPLLGLSAGVFLLVIGHDLIPHSVRHSKNGIHYFRHSVWFFTGLILMVVINFLLGH